MRSRLEIVGWSKVSKQFLLICFISVIMHLYAVLLYWKLQTTIADIKTFLHFLMTIFNAEHTSVLNQTFRNNDIISLLFVPLRIQIQWVLTAVLKPMRPAVNNPVIKPTNYITLDVHCRVCNLACFSIEYNPSCSLTRISLLLIHTNHSQAISIFDYCIWALLYFHSFQVSVTILFFLLEQPQQISPLLPVLSPFISTPYFSV